MNLVSLHETWWVCKWKYQADCLITLICALQRICQIDNSLALLLPRMSISSSACVHSVAHFHWWWCSLPITWLFFYPISCTIEIIVAWWFTSSAPSRNNVNFCICITCKLLIDHAGHRPKQTIIEAWAWAICHVLGLRAVHWLLSLTRKCRHEGYCHFDKHLLFHNEDGAGTWMRKDHNITSLMQCSTFKKIKSVVLWLRSTMRGQSEEIWKLGRIIRIQWWVYSLSGVIRLAENRASSWHVPPCPVSFCRSYQNGVHM